MSLEQLRLATNKRPFKPFEICLAAGQRIRVRGPEFLWLPPTAQRTFVVYHEPKAADVIDLLLVASLSYGNGATNGRARRRTR